ncbi:hypothetical protein HDU67_002529 [Dinochytrium kinnereticum]|nr:hypothetical protein HDU67_002529 [Dinochytrium kinnereticum]
MGIAEEVRGARKLREANMPYNPSPSAPPHNSAAAIAAAAAQILSPVSPPSHNHQQQQQPPSADVKHYPAPMPTGDVKYLFPTSAADPASAGGVPDDAPPMYSEYDAPPPSSSSASAAPSSSAPAHPQLQQQHQQQQQQQYQRPQPPASPHTQSILTNLTRIIRQNRLDRFYPTELSLSPILSRLSHIDFGKLSRNWRLPIDKALSLVALSLYDIIIFCDDSGSMKEVEAGSRIEDLKVILERVADIAAVFAEDGVAVRFINSPLVADNVRTPEQVRDLVSRVDFLYQTPLGSQMEIKIMEPLVNSKIRSGTFHRPTLIITITDGEPYPEPRDTFHKVLSTTLSLLRSHHHSDRSVVHQLCQCGKDPKATAFLEELDRDVVVGHVVDSISFFEREAERFARGGVKLTPDLFLVKLCLGAVDKNFKGGGSMGSVSSYSSSSSSSSSGTTVVGDGGGGGVGGSMASITSVSSSASSSSTSTTQSTGVTPSGEILTAPPRRSITHSASLPHPSQQPRGTASSPPVSAYATVPRQPVPPPKDPLPQQQFATQGRAPPPPRPPPPVMHYQPPPPQPQPRPPQVMQPPPRPTVMMQPQLVRPQQQYYYIPTAQPFVHVQQPQPQAAYYLPQQHQNQPFVQQQPFYRPAVQQQPYRPVAQQHGYRPSLQQMTQAQRMTQGIVNGITAGVVRGAVGAALGGGGGGGGDGGGGDWGGGDWGAGGGEYGGGDYGGGGGGY